MMSFFRACHKRVKELILEGCSMACLQLLSMANLKYVCCASSNHESSRANISLIFLPSTIYCKFLQIFLSSNKVLFKVFLSTME